MAGSGWDPSGIEPAITISGDGQTATRSGDSSYDSVRGLAGRSKGRRYFEITPDFADLYDSFCSGGFMSADASLDVELGAGTPIAAGWKPASGTFRYSYVSGSGVRADQDNVSAGVLGILIDFDEKTCTVYRDGAIDWVEVMDIANDTVLYPAASLYRDTSMALQTVEPFQYPPEVSFVAWDRPDSDLRTKVSGIMEIEGAPVARMLKAFSFERLTFDLDGQTITESKPLGQTISNDTTGEYEIILRGGFPREVFVVAFDDYGAPFESGATVQIGDRIHPSTPNGYVYECTGSGTLSETEPTWSTDTETGQTYGTASLIARPFYRPAVHGPINPEDYIFVPWDPLELFQDGEAGVWYDPSDTSTLFQDSAGTIPVTADGDPVGLMIDKTGNGFHATQANASSRPFYRTDGSLHWIESTGSQYMTIQGSASGLIFIHSGSGGHLSSACSFGTSSNPDALLPLAGSNAASNTNVGFSLRYDDRSGSDNNNKFVAQISSFGNVYAFVSGPDFITPLDPHVIELNYKEGSSPEISFSRDGTVADTDSSSLQPDTGASVYDIDLFRTGNALYPGAGKIFSFVMVGRIPDSEEQADLYQFHLDASTTA